MRIEDGGNGLQLRVGERKVSINAGGFSVLRFEGKPQLYDLVSAVDLLAGKVDVRTLRGKIVFIGSSAVILNDLHPTVVNAAFQGR